ncbi:hypothetical protein [Rhizobium leguminosarum]|uniref:hypothetical protein n=1 Tax=Rhizobium leguminosarum TaxID=384 RepID=UPI003F9CA343
MPHSPIILDPATKLFLGLQRPSYSALPSADACIQLDKDVLNFSELFGEYAMRQPSCTKCLDIGAGIGIGTLSLYRMMGRRARYTLLDVQGTSEEVYYGFNKVPARYNDFSTSLAFLANNAVDLSLVEVFDVDSGSLPSSFFDNVISIMAWGYMFPIDVYYDYVMNRTVAGSVVYIDVRHGTFGETYFNTDWTLLWSASGFDSFSMIWRRR